MELIGLIWLNAISWLLYLALRDGNDAYFLLALLVLYAPAMFSVWLKGRRT